MMKNLNNEDMKEIVYEITDEELKDNNEKVYPVTYDEYFNKLDDSVKLKISDRIIRNVDGYNRRGNIVVFLDRIYQNKGNLAWKIFRLAENTYHEVRHSVQKKFDSYSYEGFLGDIDNVLSVIRSDIYYSNSSSFSYELGANLYGLQKAREYMLKQFPEQYKKIIKKIETTEEKYKFDYMMYDASYSVNRFVIELRKNPDITNKYSLNELSPVLDVFMNLDLTFKSLGQIINNNKFKRLDKKIVCAILSSRVFYENINIEELSNEELELLKTSLNYTHEIYQNQSTYLQKALNKRIIDNRAYYQNQKNILGKLKPIAELENLIMLQRRKINNNIR